MVLPLETCGKYDYAWYAGNRLKPPWPYLFKLRFERSAVTALPMILNFTRATVAELQYSPESARTDSVTAFPALTSDPLVQPQHSGH